MYRKVKSGYRKFTGTFWILILAVFIDGLGGALFFPFFSLYVTEHFKVGITQVGYIFSLFSLGSIGGSILGGALADKFGRRLILLIGIIISGLSSLLMGIIQEIQFLYILALILGVVGSIGLPAQQAMVADLLPPELQADGYGMIRVAINLTFAIGPLLGSILLAKPNLSNFWGIFGDNSYMILFVGDAVLSSITAIIVIFSIPETKPEKKPGEKEESIGQTFVGYLHVLKDDLFMLFLLLSALVSLVYMQMNSTLSVFLRDQHDFSALQFGYLLSMNAFMVVCFQFPITRLISIITIGEMIISPFSQSLVARLSPEDKRGRYMAIFGFSWKIPSLFGIIVAGVIMDNYNPNLVWIYGGIILLFVTFGYLALKGLATKRLTTNKNLKNENKFENS
ncbi:MAG: MFS transporter [Promethearchaeota archaeon]